MDLALAIELETSGISVGVVNRAGKVVDAEAVTPGDEHRAPGYEGMLDALDAIRSRVARLDGALAVCGVSVGGGDHLGTNARNEDEAAERVHDRLCDVVGLPLYADTEGRAFALAEGWVGAARGVEHFAAVKVGETVRGGIVLDGRLLDGELGRAGRLGHVIVEPDGRRCPCGARGCLEAEVSVGAIEAATGRPLSEPSYDHMRRVGRLVGRVAASVANFLDLKLIVCGGLVAREYASTMFLAAQEELDTSCQLSFSMGARIVSARTPDAGGLIGAAAVGWLGLANER